MSEIPEFLFIGGARCASTWLHDCLTAHPQTCVPRRPKELNFFNRDSNYEKGLDWYRRFWEHKSENQVCGEVTPTYLCHQLTAQRIKSHFPNIKLIVCLRNPIDRTYSAYRGHVLAGRIDPGVTVRAASNSLTFDNQSSLIDHAFYFRHLKRFLEHFTSEQLFIYLFDDVRADPLGTIARVFEFLEVDSNFVPPEFEKKVNTGFQIQSRGASLVRRLFKVGNHKASNPNPIRRSFEIAVRIIRNQIVKPETTTVPPHIVEELLPIFKDENKKLAQLIGRDLTHWNQGADDETINA